MVFRQAKLAEVRPRRRRGIAMALLLGLSTASGCEIKSFDAPALVALGETISLTLDVASLGDITSGVDLHVMLRVPSDWSVQPAITSWSGIVGGILTSGTPTISSSNPSAFCDFTTFVGAPPSGMKDIYFSEAFSEVLQTDEGRLDARFTVKGATGTFKLLAVTAAEDGTTGSCDDTAEREIRVLTAIPIDQPWALIGLALGLAATGLLATRRRARLWLGDASSAKS